VKSHAPNFAILAIDAVCDDVSRAHHALGNYDVQERQRTA